MVRVRRLVGRGLIAMGLCVATTTVSVGLTQSAAHASAASVVCGGVKHGTGWKTNSTGGTTYGGCGAGIDYVATPTSAYSTYYFGTLPAGDIFHPEAYIPTVFATAYMNFSVYECGVLVYNPAVNESNLHGQWLDLGQYSSNGDCEVHVTAWSGLAHAAYLGLDAIRNVG